MRRCAALFLLVALVAGCAAAQAPPDPVAFMADTLTLIGQRGLRLNAAYVDGCRAHRIDEPRCAAWARFFQGEFRPGWLAAYDAFTVAIGAGDLATAQAKVRLAEALAQKLTLYLLEH